MNRLKSSLPKIAMSALLGMCVSGAIAEQPTGELADRHTLDVVLHKEGLFVGQVVQAQGQGKSGIDVSLRDGHREIFRTRTDREGRFALRGLSPGMYQLATNRGQTPVRVWTKTTAPPSAVLGALLVDGATVRGQDGGEFSGSEVIGSGIPTPSDESNQSVLLNAPDNTTYYTSDEAEPVEELTVAPTPEMTGFSETPYDATFGAPATSGRGPFRLGLLGDRGLLSRPVVYGLGVAAAIAIPIALDDDDAS